MSRGQICLRLTINQMCRITCQDTFLFKMFAAQTATFPVPLAATKTRQLNYIHQREGNPPLGARLTYWKIVLVEIKSARTELRRDVASQRRPLLFENRFILPLGRYESSLIGIDFFTVCRHMNPTAEFLNCLS